MAAWEREVRLVVAKATRLPALVLVVRNSSIVVRNISIAEFLLGRLRHVLRVQLAPKRPDVVVFASQTQPAGLLALILLLSRIFFAILLLARYIVLVYARRRRRRRPR